MPKNVASKTAFRRPAPWQTARAFPRRDATNGGAEAPLDLRPFERRGEEAGHVAARQRADDECFLTRHTKARLAALRADLDARNMGPRVAAFCSTPGPRPIVAQPVAGAGAEASDSSRSEPAPV